MTSAPWELPAPRDRIVAVGDVHADLDALLRILMGAELVDADGRWVGAGCHLVLVGDLVDRGADSVATTHYVMDLQAQAAARGDRVDALLGNHELLVAAGDFAFAHPGELEALASFRYGGRFGLAAVFAGNGPWARWLRSRPAVLKVGSAVFVHAGPDARMLDLTLARINHGLQAAIARLQGAEPFAADPSSWCADPDGQALMWSRVLMVGRRPPWHLLQTAATLRQVLSHLQADLMVAGHSPTAAIDFRVAWPHPDFGQAVAVIDTGISRCYGGRLSALEIAHGSVRALYFERGEAELPATARLRESTRQALHVDHRQSG